MSGCFDHQPPAPAIDRRRTLSGGLAIGFAAIAGRASASAGGLEPVVETRHGRIRGRAANGAHVFKGIRYAASTAGANRFLPPRPVAPWSGVRDALAYGETAPQARDTPPSRATTPAGAIPPVSEDCLFLNVFTPSADRASRRPVMVWMHGGGWHVGSGSAPTQDGTNLAKFGDVVVVTFNHRLSAWGFIQLEDADERFADSGNTGVLDMIAALGWVRDNIEGFGGDPGNVTIFGVSGGASKVSALMAAPAAQGLFHKVIAQSASGCIRIVEREEAARMTRALAQSLGVRRATPDMMQRAPVAAVEAAMLATTVHFRPILDGRTFTRHPFDPDAPPISAHLPFMSGNTANETTIHMSRNMENFSLGAAEVRARIAGFLPTDAAGADRILAAYNHAYPSYAPWEILNAVTTDYNYHRNTRRMAQLQAEPGRAPVYSYILEWRSPTLEGRLKAYHGMDIPFVFGTTELAARTLGASPDLRTLSHMIMASWTSFARNGDPNNELMPNWPRFDPNVRQTMMLNLPSRVEDDPGGQARAALEGLPWFEYSMERSFF